GKALAEIDGVVVARELRHRLEDGDGKVGEDLVHGGHGAVSRRSWPVTLLASSPICRPPDACRRADPPLAPPATPSPSVFPSGRRTPPACCRDREWPLGQRWTTAPRRRP